MIFKTQLKKPKTNIMTFDDNNNNNNNNKIKFDMEGNIYIICSSTLLENENNNNIIIFTFNHVQERYINIITLFGFIKLLLLLSLLFYLLFCYYYYIYK